jgi:hypothetical protein
MYVIAWSAVPDSQNILTTGMKLRIIFLLHNTLNLAFGQVGERIKAKTTIDKFLIPPAILNGGQGTPYNRLSGQQMLSGTQIISNPVLLVQGFGQVGLRKDCLYCCSMISQKELKF